MRARVQYTEDMLNGIKAVLQEAGLGERITDSLALRSGAVLEERMGSLERVLQGPITPEQAPVGSELAARKQDIADTLNLFGASPTRTPETDRMLDAVLTRVAQGLATSQGEVPMRESQAAKLGVLATSVGRLPWEFALMGASQAVGLHKPLTRSALVSDLATKGSTPFEIGYVLLSASDDRLVGTGETYSEDLRQRLVETRGDLVARTELPGVVDACREKMHKAAEAVALSRMGASAHDVRIALDLDRYSPSRAAEFVREHGLSTDNVTGREPSEKVDAYRKATKHVSVPAPAVSSNEVYELGQQVDRARELCRSAGIAIGSGENMPDYYFSVEQVRELGSCTVDIAAITSHVKAVSYTSVDTLAAALPLVETLPALLPPLYDNVGAADAEESVSGADGANPATRVVDERLTLEELALARETGCRTQDVVDVVSLTRVPQGASDEDVEHGKMLRKAVFCSPSFRETVKVGTVDREVLLQIARVLSRKGRVLSGDEERDVRWFISRCTSGVTASDLAQAYDFAELARILVSTDTKLLESVGGLKAAFRA
jgi:hypothetical protein